MSASSTPDLPQGQKPPQRHAGFRHQPGRWAGHGGRWKSVSLSVGARVRQDMRRPRRSGTAYYAFIMAGRREVNGLPWVGEDRLIPLKAIAWLELTARKEQGAKVDAKDVRKHLNDVLRLSQLLAPATRIPVDKKIGADMTRFLVAVAADTSIDPKALQLGNVAVVELVARIAQAYEIELPARRRDEG
ncbi:hypothetical protein Bpro_1554 [Polaromonas sp. JS666]|nr:hypothetical protein Bpro_1554 [Polaromonas sp. JS666]